MANNLPESWAETQLEEILISLESGSRPKGGVRGISSGIPSIGGEHLKDNGSFDFSNIKYVPEQFALKMNRGQIKIGDVLIVKDGATTGKTSYVNESFPYEQAFVNEHVFICRTSSELISKFVFYFLWSNDGKSKILDNFQGAAQGGINTGFSSNTLVPIAPLPEQHRIVAKLDALYEKIASNKQRLEKIPKLLKRFRQSVLAAAVSGKLTEDWRDKNNDYLKPFQGIKDKNKIIDSDIHTSWIQTKLTDISERVSVGHVGPTTRYYTDKEKGIPFIRSQNVRRGFLDLNGIQFITQEFHNSLKKSQLKSGDLLVVRVGANCGDACILPEAMGKMNCANIVFARPFQGLSSYLGLYFISPVWLYQIAEISTGSAQPVINTAIVAETIIDLPSLVEQKEIVRRVEQLFAFADKIEARYTKAKAMLDKLPQSILAKAFRGELVPQNPDDEPASMLLERIKAEKEKSAKEKKIKTFKK